MAHHGFGMGGGGIDPNDLSLFQDTYTNHINQSPGFSSGLAQFGDDELLEGLASPTGHQAGLSGPDQGFGGLDAVNMTFSPGIYRPSHAHNMNMDPGHGHGFSPTPEPDTMHSPFATSFPHMRQMQGFSGPLQSPMPYNSSPLLGQDPNNEGNMNYLAVKSRARLSLSMQRNPSHNRTPLSPAPQPQPIRTSAAPGGMQHDRGWIQTPNSLESSFPSGLSSPIPPNLHNSMAAIYKGAQSVPAKVGTANNAMSSQEMKKKRRRESHNLVERRRRDNINERIQDLSKLVPAHRLEDEKIKKAIQNGTPLSPTLPTGSSPTQATSGLAGPGQRRATSVAAGTITTGLPVDDKDKGPNKGDILNGAVGWTRDLMWLLHLKIQQQDELINLLVERGVSVPFELTEDEKRMQTELIEAVIKNEEGFDKMALSYSRTAGSGLRVPHHTDYKGDALTGSSSNIRPIDCPSTSPDDSTQAGNDVLGDSGEFVEIDDDCSGDLNFSLKEEDGFSMDLTH